jgi:hypothetical protein
MAAQSTAQLLSDDGRSTPPPEETCMMEPAGSVERMTAERPHAQFELALAK